MIRTFLGIMLIIIAIIFIYPMNDIIPIIALSIFIDDNNSDRNSISFGDVIIDNFDRIEVLGTKGNKCKCKAIYFSNEQAKNIEMQIEKDKDWTESPFNERIINQYNKFDVNIENFGKAYYYLIKYDRNNVVIETNRDIIDSKGAQWYDSAIYDSKNKILYNYYEFYER